MNKYFIQLFLKEKTVVMPGFGALAVLNENFKNIIFVPDLKTDDGKLANYISETEGVDEQTAQNMIAKFIREIEANLNKGESFDIFEFGSFTKSESGEIVFESWLTESKKNNPPDISSQQNQQETIEKDTSEKNPTEIKVSIESNTPSDDFLKKENQSVNRTQELDSVALIQALLNGEFKEDDPKPVKKDKEPRVLEPIVYEQPKKEIVPKLSTNQQPIDELKKEEQKNEKKKKKKFPFWTLLLLFFIVGLGIWSNFNSIGHYLPLVDKNPQASENKKDTTQKKFSKKIPTADTNSSEAKHQKVDIKKKVPTPILRPLTTMA